MIHYMLLQLRRRFVKVMLFTTLLSLSGAFVAVSAGLWVGSSQSMSDAASAFTTIAFRKDLPRSNPLTMFQSLTFGWDDIQLAYSSWQGDMDSEISVAKEGMIEYILQSDQVYAMWAENAPQVMQVDRRQAAFGYSQQVLSRVPEVDAENVIHRSDMYALAVFLAEYREENQPPADDPNYDSTVRYFDVVDVISVHPSVAAPTSVTFRMLPMPELHEGLYLLFGELIISEEGNPTLYERTSPMRFERFLEKRLEMPLYLPEGLEAFAWQEPELHDALLLLIDNLDITYHSVQLFGTDNLHSILPFAARDAVIVEGRGFDATDYGKGSNVCLMPAGLARQNGLSVGDTVTFYVYRGFPLVTSSSLWLGGLYGVSAIYYDITGVQGGGFQEENAYTIVGMYQAPEWQIDNHALTPNTLIVPNSSFEKSYFGVPLGVFYSLILENGSNQAFEETVTGEGLGGVFAYYDQGYSKVKGAIETMRNSTTALLSISGFVWFVVLLFFIFFYLMKMQKEVATMRTLGTSKTHAFAYVMLGATVIALASGCMGAGIGLVVYDHAASTAFEAAVQQNQVNLFFSDLVSGDTGDWVAISKSFRTVIWASILQCFGVLSTAAGCCAAMARKQLLRMVRL